MSYSYVGCFIVLDKDIYPNPMVRAVASCVSFHSRNKVTPEDVYEYIAKNMMGFDVRKMYKECIKHFGVDARFHYKDNASAKDITKIIDKKIPIIYNGTNVIVGYSDNTGIIKVKFENSENYVDYVKGGICW